MSSYAHWAVHLAGYRAMARAASPSRYRMPDSTRAAILRRDPVCCYCGYAEAVCVDHVDALARGGRDAVDNLVGACRSCNSSKCDSPLLLWLATRSKEALRG